jgi:hypothetical protein
MKTRAPALALCLTLAGCMHQTGGVAPSTIPLAPGGYTVLGNVRGKDCVWHLLGLIPVSSGNMTYRAVSEALAERPEATALINVTADTHSEFWIVLSRTCTEVHGTEVAE